MATKIKSVSQNQVACRIPEELLPKGDGGKYTASDKGSKNKKRANKTRRNGYNFVANKKSDSILYPRKGYVYRAVRIKGQDTFIASARLGKVEAVFSNWAERKAATKVNA